MIFLYISKHAQWKFYKNPKSPFSDFAKAIENKNYPKNAHGAKVNENAVMWNQNSKTILKEIYKISVNHSFNFYQY